MLERLHQWLEAQLTGAKTERNSGLGKATTYLLRHWRADRIPPRGQRAACGGLFLTSVVTYDNMNYMSGMN